MGLFAASWDDDSIAGLLCCTLCWQHDKYMAASQLVTMLQVLQQRSCQLSRSSVDCQRALQPSNQQVTSSASFACLCACVTCELTALIKMAFALCWLDEMSIIMVKLRHRVSSDIMTEAMVLRSFLKAMSHCQPTECCAMLCCLCLYLWKCCAGAVATLQQGLQEEWFQHDSRQEAAKISRWLQSR